MFVRLVLVLVLITATVAGKFLILGVLSFPKPCYYFAHSLFSKEPTVLVHHQNSFILQKRNGWIVCAIIRPFRDKEMLIWKIKR